jgi:hypothetical protein
MARSAFSKTCFRGGGGGEKSEEMSQRHNALFESSADAPGGRQ